MNNSKIYKKYDLLDLNLLPPNWYECILELANSKSYLIHLDGNSITSREPTGSKGTDVFVVDGEEIETSLSWLNNLYKNELLSIVNDNSLDNFCISNSVKNGININYLKGKNARYEWHVDSNPLTGILFATTHHKGEGGELVFNTKASLETVYPKKGIFILFDAREIPHTVYPLLTDTFRISVPMNFYLDGVDQNRPLDLDSYIYKI